MTGPLLKPGEAPSLLPKPGRIGFFSYLRTISYYIHIALATVVLGLWGLLTQLRKGLHGANRVASVWVSYILRAARWHMGVAVEVRGAPPRAGEDVLIAAKHQSFLDILAIACAAERRAFVMKREIMRVPIMGWYAREVGSIPIDRSKGRDAMAQIVSAARSRMATDDGLGHLIIYPEGTRTRPSEHRPYKHGVGTIHLETGLPVYPVAVNCGLFWPKRGIPVASGRAVIEFLPPMQAEPGETRDSFIRRLQQTIETRSNALMAEAGFNSKP